MLKPPQNSFFQIQIFHLPTSDISRNSYNMVKFQGWVTEFRDQYQSKWNEEEVYGRMDPLATFQNTRRSINLGFDVVSEDALTAQSNLVSVDKLITFLYPVYRAGERTRSNTLAAGPLLGFRWTNLAADAATGDYLVGYLNGVDYNPTVTDGGFINNRPVKVPGQTELITTNVGGETDTTVKSNPDNLAPSINFIPKTLSINLQFTVLHTHLTGWVETDEGFIFGNEKVNGKYPNAFNVVETEKPVQALTNDFDGKPNFTVNTIGDSLASSVLGASTTATPGVVEVGDNPWGTSED